MVMLRKFLLNYYELSTSSYFYDKIKVLSFYIQFFNFITQSKLQILEIEKFQSQDNNF